MHRMHTAEQGVAQRGLLLPGEPFDHAVFDLPHLLIARLERSATLGGEACLQDPTVFRMGATANETALFE
jgi:hypothetical protein